MNRFMNNIRKVRIFPPGSEKNLDMKVFRAHHSKKALYF